MECPSLAALWFGRAVMASWQDALATHTVVADVSGAPCAADTSHRTALLATRGTDLIAVVQNELRITSMSHLKRTVEHDGTSEGVYKTLVGEHLDFPIQAIYVNPTGKLLAVVGTHSLVLVILPRRGYMHQVGSTLPVKTVRIGAYYHAPHANAPIAQCRWHPCGADGASLVVLTDDAIVREYDVSRDVDEPQQTIAALPRRTRASSVFSAEDDDNSLAVSFSFGHGLQPTMRDVPSSPSWLAFTLFVLMQSGDVYVLCPFMPKYAAFPRADIEALAAHEARKSSHMTLPVRFIGDLARQMHDTAADDASLDAEHIDGMVQVTMPVSVPHRLASQGPCLLRPEPVEFNDEVAASACDILVTSLASEAGNASLDVIGIATRQGGIHWGFLASPIEPQWVVAYTAAPPALPAIATCECIDLELPQNEAPLHTLQFVKDSLYPDMVFVTHMHGMHAMSLEPLTQPLLTAMANGSADALGAEAKQRGHTAIMPLVRLESSDNAAVTGALTINDVYLSYAFIVLTSDAQLVMRELSLRPVTGTHISVDQPKHTYKSLLHEPFVPPHALSAPPKAIDAKGAIDASPAALRAFGQATEAVRQRLEDVAHAGQSIQARVAQQMREMQRQVTCLAQAVERTHHMRAETLEKRIANLDETQRSTMRRLDSLLQHLMDEHAPQLSVYERRWFDELQRMSREFLGDNAQAKEHLLKVCYGDRLTSAGAPVDIAADEPRSRTGYLAGSQAKRAPTRIEAARAYRANTCA